MSEINKRLEGIIQKISRTVDNCVALEEENFLLEEENKTLRKKIQEKDVREKKLTDKLNILKQSKGVLMEGKESKKMKEQIDLYLKEIDKCISMLNG